VDFLLVLPLISFHSICCFGWIWERRIWALRVFLPLHLVHRFEFSLEIRWWKKEAYLGGKPIVTNLLGPNLVGDQHTKTWSIGVCWRALETWLYHEELKDLHQYIVSSQLGYLVYIIYPMFLFVVTCTQLIYTESYSPLLHVLVVFRYMCCYMLCYLLVFILINQVCTCGFAHHVCVFVFEPILHLILYYLALLRDYWTIPFLGNDMLWHFTILNMCAHEEYHLVLIFEFI
jgi:hypothetical protein